VEPSLGRDVALDVLADGKRLGPNEEIASTARFSATSRNIGAMPAYALVFVVDARHDVHWVCPEYLDASSHPSSAFIAASPADKALGAGSIAFDDLAPGPGAVVSVLSHEPIAVDTIEAMKNVTPEQLARDLPGADVRSLPVRIRMP
jgi:hypothetical protein